MGLKVDLGSERSSSSKWVLEAMQILHPRELVFLCASARMLGTSTLGDISLGSLGPSKPRFQIVEGKKPVFSLWAR